MADAKSLVRSAWGITAWTAVSRVAGLLREVVVARLLGASALSDAFVTAFRIPNTFRAIVGEGGLPGAFVPLAKKVERESPGEEGAYAGRVLSLLLVVLVALVALGVLFAPLVVGLFASGFRGTPGKFELTVSLTRWLFPYVLFVSAASLLEAYLNSKGRFQLPAAAPAVWNLMVVACALALVPLGVPVLAALVAGVLSGGIAQALMQVPAARRLGFRSGGSPFGDPLVKRTAIQIAPRLYGYGIGQLNFLISTNVLAALGDAMVTYNYLAFRIADLVRGGFVESMTRAILPSLSEQALETDQERYKATISLGLRLSAFVTLPATAALVLLSVPAVDVVLRRGRFGAEAVAGTAAALVFYALGLFAVGGVKILTQAFYALHDTRTPVAVGTFDLLAFLGLALALSGPMKHAGVALATSAGFWINFALLWLLLRRRIGPVHGRALAVSFVRLGGCAVAATLAVLGATLLVPYRPDAALALRAGWLAAAVGAGAGLYLVLARLLAAPEVGETLGVFRRGR